MEFCPDEILLYILNLIPSRQLLQVSHVNRRWRRVAFGLYWREPRFVRRVRLRELVDYPIKVLQTWNIFTAGGMSTEIVDMLERMNLEKLVLNHYGMLTLRDLENLGRLKCPIWIDSMLLREGRGEYFELVVRYIRERGYTVTFSYDDDGWTINGLRKMVGVRIGKILLGTICFWCDMPDDLSGGVLRNPLELTLTESGCRMLDCTLQISRENFESERLLSSLFLLLEERL